MLRAQGGCEPPVGHGSGGTLQPAWPWLGQLQLPAVWKSQKQRPLRHRDKRKLLDWEIRSFGWRWKASRLRNTKFWVKVEWIEEAEASTWRRWWRRGITPAAPVWKSTWQPQSPGHRPPLCHHHPTQSNQKKTTLLGVFILSKVVILCIFTFSKLAI